MYVWKFSEPVDWDKHTDGIFRRTLKIGKNSTKNLEKQQKNWEKKLENLEIGKKYLADTLTVLQIKIRCLYVFIMSCTRFRVNLHSIVAWMSRNSLLKTGAISKA